MSAGEIITQDGRRCTKVKRSDATATLLGTSTETDSPAQITSPSLTQESSSSSTDVDGELPAVLIVTSISLSTSTSAPTSTITSTITGVALTTSTSFGRPGDDQWPSPVTEGSRLNLPAGSGNSRPSFILTPTPGGSTGTPDSGTGGLGSPSDGDERASAQNPGIIAGGIIGAAVFIILLVVAWVCIRRRRRRRRLAESPSNLNSNNNSAVAVAAAEKPVDGELASTRGSWLPPTSYSTFSTKKKGAHDPSEARHSGTTLLARSEGRPSSQYLESAPIPEDPKPPPRTVIRDYAAGILGKLRGLYPSSAAHSRVGYLQQPSQNSSTRSSYNEATNGPMLQRRLTDSSLPRPRAHDPPVPGLLNPFSDPSSTNGIQRSPGFWRSPLARNPFEDPAPPDADFPFPSPSEVPESGTSQQQYHQYHPSNSSSVIVLPGRSSAGGSVRSVSLDATASEISRWRRERDSRFSARSDPFDLERSTSVRSQSARRTNASNTARSSQHLMP